MSGILCQQLFDANATDEEIAELYNDLKYIFDAPFDELINEAVNKRGCAYIEIFQTLAN